MKGFLQSFINAVTATNTVFMLLACSVFWLVSVFIFSFCYVGQFIFHFTPADINTVRCVQRHLVTYEQTNIIFKFNLRGQSFFSDDK